MRRLKRVALISTFIFLASTTSNASAQEVQIKRVIDGDTIQLRSGEYVRLLQIDAPELRENECHARQSRSMLMKLIQNARVTSLVIDNPLGVKDSYGRLLRYLYVDGENSSIEMVRLGAATPWFYKGTKGKFARQLKSANDSAMKNKRGIWKLCPETRVDFTQALQTKYPQIQSSENNKTSCDINYSGCIPAFPPDLDCSDIKKLGINPVRVIGKDVHRFDRDGDGIGCD